MNESDPTSDAATQVCRVLIADDDARLRQAVGELLEGQGFAVVGQATDGDEAVALAEQLDPDVILMDLRMPRLDGLAATRAVRDRLPLTQVIILSAYDDPALRESASVEGVYCYLVKGCPAGLIAEMVHRAFAHRKALAPPGGSPGGTFFA